MGWLGCLLDSIYLFFSFCWLDAEIICKSQRLSETSGNIGTYWMICDDLLEKHNLDACPYLCHQFYHPGLGLLKSSAMCYVDETHYLGGLSYFINLTFPEIRDT